MVIVDAGAAAIGAGACTLYVNPLCSRTRDFCSLLAMNAVEDRRTLLRKMFVFVQSKKFF